MGQFLQTNGDYNIKTAEGAKIVLDTGPGVGQVRVTGNLLVEGDTLTVSAENLNVEDNIIIVNFGETGAGVTLTYSGLQVDRGSLAAASFIFDEDNDTWILANGTSSTGFNYLNSNLRLRQIRTNAAQDSGNLYLLGNQSPDGIVSVTGTDNYETNVIDDDHIPNKKYVDDAIQNNPTFQIVSNDSRVIVSDKDTAGSLAYLNSTTGFSTTENQSAISIIVDSKLIAQFYENRFEVGGLELGGGEGGNEITSKNGISNENIYVRTQGTGRLATNFALELEKLSVTPGDVPGSTIVFAKEADIGGTGVWFVNDNTTDLINNNGELISKKKALLFSILF